MDSLESHLQIVWDAGCMDWIDPADVEHLVRLFETVAFLVEVLGEGGMEAALRGWEAPPETIKRLLRLPPYLAEPLLRHQNAMEVLAHAALQEEQDD